MVIFDLIVWLLCGDKLLIILVIENIAGWDFWLLFKWAVPVRHFHYVGVVGVIPENAVTHSEHIGISSI